LALVRRRFRKKKRRTSREKVEAKGVGMDILYKKDKGFYYGMVESFQRLMYFNYHLWRLDRIIATPTSEDFTIAEKTKLVKDTIEELIKGGINGLSFKRDLASNGNCENDERKRI